MLADVFSILLKCRAVTPDDARAVPRTLYHVTAWGKPTSAVTSDDPKEYRKRAVDTHQKIVIQGADAGAECVLRDRDDLVDHDLRHLLEAVGCGRLYREAKERGVEDLRGQQTDRYTTNGRKVVGLQDESRTGLAAVMAFGGDRYDIAPFYAGSHAAISAMKFSAGFS